MTGGTPSGRVRALTPAEIDAYDVLPAELAARVRVVRVPFVPGPYTGAALGRTILLDVDVPADGWSLLLAHELVHVRQWAELGIVGFAVRYLTDFARNLVRTRSWGDAYRRIGIEVEARQIADEWRRRRNTRPPTRD